MVILTLMFLFALNRHLRERRRGKYFNATGGIQQRQGHFEPTNRAYQLLNRFSFVGLLKRIFPNSKFFCF